jgi:hypothetical protein
MKVMNVTVALRNEHWQGSIARRDDGTPAFVRSIESTRGERLSMADCSLELYDALMRKAEQDWEERGGGKTAIDGIVPHDQSEDF